MPELEAAEMPYEELKLDNGVKAIIFDCEPTTVNLWRVRKHKLVAGSLDDRDLVELLVRRPDLVEPGADVLLKLPHVSPGRPNEYLEYLRARNGVLEEGDLRSSSTISLPPGRQTITVVMKRKPWV